MEHGDNDFTYYWSLVKRRFPYMVAAFLVVFLTVTIISVWLPPIYRSEARILVQSQQIPQELVRSTVTALADERIQVIKQRITTRDTIIDLSRKFNLFPEKRKKLSTSELVSLLRSRIDIRLYDIGTGRRRSAGSAFTIAFAVSFEHEIPNTAAKVANELVTLILSEDKKTRTDRATETSQFLDRETKRLERKLANVEQQISQFKTDNRGALPAQLPVHQAALERAQRQLLALSGEIVAAEEEIRFLKFELSVRTSTQEKSASGFGASSGGTDAKRRLAALKTLLAEKRVTYSDKHPDVRALTSQITALEQRIAEEARAISISETETERKVASLNKEDLDIQSRVLLEKINTKERRRKSLVDQRDKLDGQIEEINALLGKIPAVESGLAILERARESAQSSLSLISDKLRRAKLGERLENDQQAERLQVLEQPVAPQRPVKPNRKMIIAIGTGFAFAAAVGAAIILEALDPSLKGSNDLLGRLNRRALVVVPYIRTRREQRMRVMRVLLFLVLCILFVGIGLLALHFYYMPLDILVSKIVHRLSF